MTVAILSFRTPGQVRLRCARPVIDETRSLGDPPFAAWARAYGDAHRHPAEEIRLLELGRAIGAWLDGSERWLARLVEAAPAPLILEIETAARSGRPGEPGAPDAPDAVDHAARDAPWELIAEPSTGHLALDERIRLSPVRRLDVPGEPRPPSRCRLSVLFMAAQPRDVTALDFEREEAAIAAEIAKLGPDELDLFVEESGTLDGLVDAAQRAADDAIDGGDDRAGPVDVIHLSCHGVGGDAARLLLEDDVGDRAPATAGDLARELAAHVPALGFVSACSTAEASAAGRSLAAQLCARGWPAVLGWSSPVADGDATWFAARLYHRVAQRLPLADALAWCRCAAVAPGQPRAVWHQARLFLGGAGGGSIAGGRGARRPRRAGQRAYLDRIGRVPVARDDEFVGRRRALQNVLAALRDPALLGAVVHGAGQLGKSSLAARVSQRRSDLHTVVVYRDYDAGAILAEVARGQLGADPILARHRPPGDWDAASLGRALRELLEGPCRAAGDGAILLVIDDFEQVLVPPQAPETHARVDARLAPTVAALIAAFAGARTASRLLFTSRYRFVLPDAHNLTRHLWHEPLGAMPADDLAKQVRARAARGRPGQAGGAIADRRDRQAVALALCHGNPGLLQILLTIIDRAPASWPAIERELRAYAATGAPVTESELAAFLARVALAELIGALRPDERELLRLLTSFETHVPVWVAAELGGLARIAEPDLALAAVERLISMGLVDLALAASNRPGRDATAHAEDREIAVERLAVPPLIAATQPLDDDTRVGVARHVLGPLRAVWDAAVHDRSFRECSELTRLARLAADTTTLAEVAGPVAAAIASTDARQATALAVAIEASDALWPEADELRGMADACRTTGHPEIAGRLLQRGLALRDLAPAPRARLQFAFAHWHRRRGEFPAAEALLHAAGDAFERLGDVRSKAVTMGKIADILQARGQLDEALRIRREEEMPVYERLGDVREKAVTMGQIADILQARGQLDEALRIRREEEMPVYERLGDVREKAVMMGKIADILRARGQLDEALRIRREEELPVYEWLGDVREKAVTMGKIADILQARGQLDEALRIRREEELPVYERLGDVREKAVTMGKIADILQARGQLDEALRIRREEAIPVYERLGDVRSKAMTMGQIADILQARGQLDEALRILNEDVLQAFERLGDVRSKAVTMGKIADILQARGQLDEALRILNEDVLQAFERLGDVREKAVTMGQIADILQARGQLDEVLRIRREEVLPVYERLGDVQSKAVTMGKIADILQARGQLDEALRIRREEALPVYERLGDMRSKAVTMGQIASILQARGQLDEALRIWREEALPVYERLGDVRSLCAGLANYAQLLLAKPTGSRIKEARDCLRRSVEIADQIGIPFPDRLRELLSQLESLPGA